MEVSARTHHCLGFTFFRDCSTSRSASFSTAGLRTPGSTKNRNKTVTLLEHLEQVAFLRLTSQKLPCSSPPPRSSMCNPSSAKPRVWFSSVWENPTRVSHVFFGGSWDVCELCKRNVQLWYPLIPPFPPGFVSWPRGYSQSLFPSLRVSIQDFPAFCAAGEWSLALGLRAPSGWMAWSEGGQRAASNISLHGSKPYFSWLTTSAISSHTWYIQPLPSNWYPLSLAFSIQQRVVQSKDD